MYRSAEELLQYNGLYQRERERERCKLHIVVLMVSYFSYLDVWKEITFRQRDSCKLFTNSSVDKVQNVLLPGGGQEENAGWLLVISGCCLMVCDRNMSTETWQVKTDTNIDNEKCSAWHSLTRLEKLLYMLLK